MNKVKYNRKKERDVKERISEEMLEKVGLDKERIREILMKFDDLWEELREKVERKGGVTIMERKVIAGKLVIPELAKEDVYMIDHFFNRLNNIYETRVTENVNKTADELELYKKEIKRQLRNELDDYYEKELSKRDINELKNKIIEDMDEYIFSLDPSMYMGYLDEGAVDQKLKEAFEKKGYPINDESFISQQGEEWWVQKNEEISYTMRIEDKSLDVYVTKHISPLSTRELIVNYLIKEVEIGEVLLLELLLGQVEKEFVEYKLLEEMNSVYQPLRDEEKKSLGMMFR